MLMKANETKSQEAGENATGSCFQRQNDTYRNDQSVI